jgi:hypothetical protein
VAPLLSADKTIPKNANMSEAIEAPPVTEEKTFPFLTAASTFSGSDCSGKENSTFSSYGFTNLYIFKMLSAALVNLVSSCGLLPINVYFVFVGSVCENFTFIPRLLKMLV